ncbi:uncharacterized protein LOC143194997 [Rhynchophorus ferrugineus]|uniref:Spaetzle domain-containing protein n=1 Tax=Rhynchophorus ferrugineus TaxID=354439 RepID=A0A834I459_RHYFE|nr:hypothetical protein GWI33_015611 [Rhynchophorus ferrugineus]
MKIQSFCLVSVFVCCTVAKATKKHDNKEHSNNSRNRLLPSKGCIDMMICNNTSKYPTKIIQKLINKNKFRALFGNGSLIEPAVETPLQSLREPEPENLCRTRPISVFPQAALDLYTNKPRYIVNVPNYQQQIVYEICVNKDGKCMDHDAKPFGFSTVCKQKYNKVRLLTVSDKKKLQFGKFFMPSTCVCSLYRFV